MFVFINEKAFVIKYINANKKWQSFISIYFISLRHQATFTTVNHFHRFHIKFSCRDSRIYYL